MVIWDSYFRSDFPTKLPHKEREREREKRGTPCSLTHPHSTLVSATRRLSAIPYRGQLLSLLLCICSPLICLYVDSSPDFPHLLRRFFLSLARSSSMLRHLFIGGEARREAETTREHGIHRQRDQPQGTSGERWRCGHGRELADQQAHRGEPLLCLCVCFSLSYLAPACSCLSLALALLLCLSHLPSPFDSVVLPLGARSHT